jgi:hypothetical protein
LRQSKASMPHRQPLSSYPQISGVSIGGYVETLTAEA